MIKEVVPTRIPGCLRLRLDLRADLRGAFVKSFHEPVFKAHGLATNFCEEYYSLSKHGVVRGMHFQVPPADLVKTVCCATGRVLDVVVDLRVGSPTYGQHEAFILDAAAPEIVYIPAGLAHGFLVLSTESLMLYQVTHDYAPKSDSGIRWDSCGIAWGVTNPVVSERDDALPRLADFASPFRYSGQS